MKKGIHPEYKVVRVSCACGNSFEVRSTRGEDYQIEICSRCHPFYKGTEEEKLVDKFGMIEKFRKRYKDFAKEKFS
jgi:large subunit ribosomal protein L31